MKKTKTAPVSAPHQHGPNCNHDHGHSHDAGCVVRIRLYQPGDYPQLKAIWEAGRIHIDDCDSAASLARNIKERANGYRVFTVDLEEIGENGRASGNALVVGGAIVTFDGHRAYLYHFAVHPEYRGLGIGRALLETCEAQARDWGARHMRLSARSDGSRAVAQHIYESSRWIHEQDIWMYKKDLSLKRSAARGPGRAKARAK